MKDGKIKFADNGEVILPHWLSEKFLRLQGRRAGLYNIIRDLSREAGEIECEWWEVWKEANSEVSFPSEDSDYICEVVPTRQIIKWHKKGGKPT